MIQDKWNPGLAVPAGRLSLNDTDIMLTSRALPLVLLGGLLLAGCNTTRTEMPAAAASAAPAATAAPAAPMEKHEAAAQCWMKYDKVPSLDAKSKLVDKCIAEKTGGR
jgi:hypothetical protein